jgi:hypothetical protein
MVFLLLCRQNSFLISSSLPAQYYKGLTKILRIHKIESEYFLFGLVWAAMVVPGLTLIISLPLSTIMDGVALGLLF